MVGGKPLQNTIHGQINSVQNAWAQYGINDGVLRVILPEFRSWLGTKGFSAGVAIEHLKQQCNGTESRGSIGTGTLLYGALAAVTRPRSLDLLLGPLISSGSIPGVKSP
jgi:hypothetical protein